MHVIIATAYEQVRNHPTLQLNTNDNLKNTWHHRLERSLAYGLDRVIIMSVLVAM